MSAKAIYGKRLGGVCPHKIYLIAGSGGACGNLACLCWNTTPFHVMATLRTDAIEQEAMRSRQIAERLGVEEAHMLEFQQFNMVWDKRMTDYEHHAEDMVFAMRVST